MPSDIQDNAYKILKFLYNRQKELNDEVYIDAKDVKNGTDLTVPEVNDAVELLHESGLVERLQVLGTAPYGFHSVLITARGKYEVERRKSIERALMSSGTKLPETGSGVTMSVIEQPSVVALLQSLFRSVKPPVPEGSPYGFKEEDWENVARKKAQKNVLEVVLGYKFQSSHYKTDELKNNIKEMFEQAVNRYNTENQGQAITVEFTPLHAGYGEHLFNAIARDIISSDIAVFETSDLAPNVLIEIGVALTWGSRVFLIKKDGCPDPPSDIFGQTYAVYINDAKEFLDHDHQEKLYRMVERAIRRKG
jgi:hypothetical protein